MIDGHGYHHSTDVVEYLAARGVRTTVVTAAPFFAPGIDDHDRPDVMRALRDRPVEFVVGDRRCARSAPTRSPFATTTRGATRTLDGVDRVVLSIGQDPRRRAADALHERGINVVAVGDCVTPRGIEHAVFEGHRAGRAL